MAEKIPERIHADVVTGIVQIVRYLNARTEAGEKKGVSIGELVRAANRGNKSNWARMYICEFVKDGEVTEEMQRDVAAGDYTSVWELVNDYFERRGFGRVQPESLQIPES